MKIRLLGVFVLFLSCSDLWGASLYREGELIVKFKKGASGEEEASVFKKAGAQTLRRTSLTEAALVRLEGMSVKEAIKLYKSEPSVEYAEPNYIIRKAVTPDDTYFSLQWALQKIEAPSAWDLINTSPYAAIAVLDSGLDLDHPDLAGNIWINKGETINGIDDDGNGYVDDIRGWNFVSSTNSPADDNSDGHGTHVAGSAGAVGNNAIGVTGVSWSAELMILKILDKNGEGAISDEIAAIEYAVMMGAKVINASYTFPTTCEDVPAPRAERDAIEAALNKGVLFVAAAGNGGCSADETAFYPAGHDLRNIISVASSDEADRLAGGSNFGYESIHVAAPGEDILSTFPAGAYAYLSGTSMAAPFVSGLSALLFSHRTAFTYAMVKETIISTVDKTAALSGNSLSDGRINALSAVSASWPLRYPPVRPSRLLASPISPAETRIFFTDNSSNETGFEVVRAEGDGDFSAVATLGANSYSMDDSGMLDGRRYAYMIRAFNSSGSSGFSLPSSLITPLRAPDNLRAEALSDTEISLFWDDNSSSEDGFYIERSEGGAFSLIATVGTNVKSYTDRGLKTGISYRYRIKAFNSLTVSDYSNELSATAGKGPSGGGGGGGCFIATAAYGSPNHPLVRVLRDFRDRCLKGNRAGEKFIKLYYKVSPPIASYLEAHAFLKPPVKAALFPLACFAGLALFAGPYTLMAAGMVFLAIFSVRKKFFWRKHHRP